MKPPTNYAFGVITELKQDTNMLNILMTFIVVFSSQFATAQQSDRASSNEPDNEQWYQVELLIYANNQESVGDAELWEQQLNLNYPDNSVLLTDPSVEILSHSLPPSLDSAILQSPVIDPMALEEAAFTLLPIEEMNLLLAARKIASQRDFRILFHGAWRQFISARNKAEHIMITGGDQFDDHYELEGTIKLGVERYLHIETDLWLSTFTSNIGLLDTPWQLLPRRPNPETLSATFQENHTDNAANFYSAANDSTSPPELSSDQKRITTDSLIELFGNQFSVERTITLRQKRRMRSNELHYLDHPLVGLLVKIIPYERTLILVDNSTEQSDVTDVLGSEISTEIKMNNSDVTSPTSDLPSTTKDSQPPQESFEP
ncbi:MAG: hypothetical protein ACI92E_001056 [Oceanicoccus sp.]|jgi:hypothetical protein